MAHQTPHLMGPSFVETTHHKVGGAKPLLRRPPPLACSPDSPLGPLMARRRLDVDEDAKRSGGQAGSRVGRQGVPAGLFRGGEFGGPEWPSVCPPKRQRTGAVQDATRSSGVSLRWRRSRHLAAQADYSAPQDRPVAQVKNQGIFVSWRSRKPHNPSLFDALRLTELRSGTWATRPDVVSCQVLDFGPSAGLISVGEGVN